jgi:hypothetical protein
MKALNYTSWISRLTVIFTVVASFVALQSARAYEINSLYDAWAWYEIGGGDDVPGGSGVTSSIKRGVYKSKVEDYLLDDIEDALLNVRRSSSSGRLNSGYARVRGVRDLKSIVGSLSLDAYYTVSWTATSWKRGKRTVKAEVKINFYYEDRWDFEENTEYNGIQNWMFEWLPAFLVGEGDPYYIYGSFSDTFSVSVTQRQ